jgi:hypothetical protein
MNARLVIFILAQIGIAIVASLLDKPGTQLYRYLFDGVLSAQFALVGIWLGMGDHRIGQRLTIAVLGIIGLSAVAVTRPFFNGWEFLLALVRLLVFGVVYSFIRRNRQLVFGRASAFVDVQMFRVSLKQLFGLIFGVAAFLALDRSLESYSGPWYSMFLVIATVMVGMGGALVPLVASLASLGKRNAASAIISGFAILVLAAAIAAFTYSQTNSWRTAAQWFTSSIVEALMICASIIAFRQCGFRLKMLNNMHATSSPMPASRFL